MTRCIEKVTAAGRVAIRWNSMAVSGVSRGLCCWLREWTGGG